MGDDTEFPGPADRNTMDNLLLPVRRIRITYAMVAL